MIGKIVKVIVDRPLGSHHPTYKNIQYPVNYGYIPKILAGDGEEQVAYTLAIPLMIIETTAVLIQMI